MSEIISLHLGQAGLQVGQSVWELFCLEHGIRPDGTQAPPQTLEEGGTAQYAQDELDESARAIFSTSSEGKKVPRAVFVETESNSIGE